MNLTSNDLKNIVEQCFNQGCRDTEEFAGFGEAMLLAKMWAKYLIWDTTNEYDIKYIIHRLSEETTGYDRYRTVNARFAGFCYALSPDLIEHAMDCFIQYFLANTYPSANDMFQNFQRIHPFCDGNGRVGHLLWAIYTQRNSLFGEWPDSMPPEFDPEWQPSRYTEDDAY